MSNKEKLRAMEALWDCLCHQEKEPESPSWHNDLLDRRRARIESGEAKFYSLEEAKKMLG
ncbi:MAG: addiction module protein [Opitutales bacterium]|nr:addiction module protein [Opitutales bacterium]